MGVSCSSGAQCAFEGCADPGPSTDDLVCSEGVRSGVCAECTCPSGSALIADAADTQGSDSGTCCEAAGTDAPTPAPTVTTATTDTTILHKVNGEGGWVKDVTIADINAG